MQSRPSAVYAVRKTVVEPVFGQIKGARGQDRFRLLGMAKVNGGMGADGHHPQPAQAVQGIMQTI
ncbi:MAG: hypothetical protein FJY58_09000 [Betaproteobacteria bacterium]|nr:hypothetical protein [Betaproteobacteria bacterium]